MNKKKFRILWFDEDEVSCRYVFIPTYDIFIRLACLMSFNHPRRWQQNKRNQNEVEDRKRILSWNATRTKNIHKIDWKVMLLIRQKLVKVSQDDTSIYNLSKFETYRTKTISSWTAWILLTSKIRTRKKNWQNQHRLLFY